MSTVADVPHWAWYHAGVGTGNGTAALDTALVQLATSASSNATIDSLASQIASQCIAGAHLGLNTTTGWSNNPSNGYYGANYLFRARKYLGLAASESNQVTSHGILLICPSVCLSLVSVCLALCVEHACLLACAESGGAGGACLQFKCHLQAINRRLV